jgi:hypothetical protein
MTARTLKDLDDALTQLQRAHEQAGRRSGKGCKTEIEDAHAEVRAIERELKQAGIIPRTAQELLDAELDSAFPDAAGSDVVVHRGNRYKRRFFAVRKTARGKVQEWGRIWEGVPSTGR